MVLHGSRSKAFLLLFSVLSFAVGKYPSDDKRFTSVIQRSKAKKDYRITNLTLDSSFAKKITTASAAVSDDTCNSEIRKPTDDIIFNGIKSYPTNILLVANLYVFLVWQVALQLEGKANNSRLSDFMLTNFMFENFKRIHTLFLSAFSHMAAGHFYLNMMTLSIVGPEVSRVLGPRLFLGFYFAAILAADLFYHCLLWDKKTFTHKLGASGAIFALFAFHHCCVFPASKGKFHQYYRSQSRLSKMELRRWIGLTLLIVAIDLVPRQGSRIAIGCHVGGALFGVGTFFVYKQYWMDKKAMTCQIIEEKPSVDEEKAPQTNQYASAICGVLFGVGIVYAYDNSIGKRVERIYEKIMELIFSPR